MRSLALLVATLSAPVLLAAPVPKALKQKSDAELMEGRWECVSLDSGSGPRAEKRFLTVKGGLMSMTNEAPADADGAFTVDTANSPKQLDVTWKGWTVAQRYIYRLDDDTFTMCHAQDNQPRPAEFKGGNGAHCFVFK